MAYRLLIVGFTLLLLTYYWNNMSPRCCIQDKLDDVYDYVIVGGGTAGCVLANRLSENPGTSVLLLEAGDEETKDPRMDIPLTTGQLMRSEFDFASLTVPQKHACQGMKNQQCILHRGKVLGGTSSINRMLYVRGNRHDYDSWAANGCEGWSYKDVLPYFLKAENNRNEQFLESGYHGNVGPMIVSDVRTTSLPEAFVQAGQEMGFRAVDVNGEIQDGFMHSQATTKRGRRWSTVKGYLRPAMGRKNLHVATLATATKVLFENKRAVGVEYIRNGSNGEVRAKKEVILTAGAVGTAQLLLLSGVGPKEHLQDLKISSQANLPVGQNYQDLVTTDAPDYVLREPITITQYKAESFWVLFDYIVFGTGYLSSIWSEGIAFLRSESQPKEAKFPFIQLQLLPALLGNSKETMEMWHNYTNIKREVIEHLHSGDYMKNGVTFLPTLLHSKSRGSIRLRSKSPNDPPLIDPQFLSHPDDVKTLIEAIRITEKLGNTKMFKILGAKRQVRIHPACQGHSYDSSAYWECYIRHNTMTLNQPAGTCKMGTISDPSTVVDSQLRVKGLTGLRVADASIMPVIVSGDTSAAIVMIAEKAADLILGRVTVQSANVTRSHAEEL